MKQLLFLIFYCSISEITSWMASSNIAVTRDYGKRVAIVTGSARGMYVVSRGFDR